MNIDTETKALLERVFGEQLSAEPTGLNTTADPSRSRTTCGWRLRDE